MLLIKNNQLFNGAMKILSVLNSKGHSAYFVGGCVRDMLLGREVKDIDIVTSATPQEIKSLFPKTHSIGESFGIINVVENSINYEVATYRKENGYTDGRHPESVSYGKNPSEDSLRRDFTINALYFDPAKQEILDYAGGLADLKRGKLKTIGPPEERFNEDHLRMLRAIRFGCRLSFEIDNGIISAIKKLAPKINVISQERIRDELTKIFTSFNADYALSLFDETALLKEILPEISVMKGVDQPPEYHPEGDVFEHTRLMLSNMPIPSPELAWAIILHDVGKPATFNIETNNRVTFKCHADKGFEMSKNILKRLKFPSIFIEHVSFAVKNHMRFASITEMRASKYKSIIAAETFPLELELHRIDCMASNKFTDAYIFLLDRLIEQKGKRALIPPIMTGRKLIEIGFKPSPEFSKILSKIRELQDDGILKTSEDALNYIKTNFTNMDGD